MTKASRKNPRRLTEDDKPRRKSKFEAERNLPPIIPRTENQSLYLEALKTSEQIIVTGPAGCGKTWIPATWAADRLRAGEIDKIIITRPAVSAAKGIGFLPGTLDEKFLFWCQPVVGAITERIGKAAFEIALKNGQIELAPMEYMRGRSFHDAFVLVDEVQNLTAHEAKMLMTRMGERCQVVLNGDVQQSDLSQTSGLRTIVHLAKKYSIPVPVIEFTMDDIVRSDLTAAWVKAFYRENL